MKIDYTKQVSLKRINLRKERQEKHLSQEATARAIDLSLRCYQQIEAGNTKGGKETWERIAKFFGKSVEYLSKQEEKGGVNNG